MINLHLIANQNSVKQQQKSGVPPPTPPHHSLQIYLKAAATTGHLTSSLDRKTNNNLPFYLSFYFSFFVYAK